MNIRLVVASVETTGQLQERLAEQTEKNKCQCWDDE